MTAFAGLRAAFCLLLSLFVFALSSAAHAGDETIGAGAYIVDLGQSPQTVASPVEAGGGLELCLRIPVA